MGSLIINYTLQLLGQLQSVIVLMHQTKGKIPSTGQVFLYENPWILCLGPTFLPFKLTF